MKECTIIVKKVYETKRTRTVTERTVCLSENALAELCTLVLEHVYNGEESLLHPFLVSIREV